MTHLAKLIDDAELTITEHPIAILTKYTCDL